MSDDILLFVFGVFVGEVLLALALVWLAWRRR